MSEEFKRLSKHQPLIRSLYETCKEKLGFEPDVKIVILRDSLNSENPLGKTAYYDPASHKVGLYTQGRHIKDIMRSLSHELVHHSQNCRGDFDKGIATVEGYAQEDGHLREMEREAYETGNLLFRDWEDNLKHNNNEKLFTNTSIMGEKLMENKETKLREVIRGLVKEMLISVEENIDDEKGDAEEDTARAAEVSSQAATTAALGGVEEEGEEERDEPYEIQSEERDPGGGDEADVEEEGEGVEEEEGEEGEEEEMDESFFPNTHDIREKARFRTHESLMKRWGYNKK